MRYYDSEGREESKKEYMAAQRRAERNRFKLKLPPPEAIPDRSPDHLLPGGFRLNPPPATGRGRRARSIDAVLLKLGIGNRR
jgi:hypothetical protein